MPKPSKDEPKDQTKRNILLLPKSKLSGSREWLTNLFSSPNKSRNDSMESKSSGTFKNQQNSFFL